MTPEILAIIAKRDFEINPTITNVLGRYEGTRVPLRGLVDVTCTNHAIEASIVHRGDWEIQMMRGLPSSTAVPFGTLFRDINPGTLIHATGNGTIIPDGAGWEAIDAIYYRQNMRFTQEDGYQSTYGFRVRELLIHGPARGVTIAAVRQIYAGAEWNATSTFDGRQIIVRSHTTNSLRIEDEIASVTVDGPLDEEQSNALWLLLSFVSGNRLHALAEERYDEQAELIEVSQQRGAGFGIGRDSPFDQRGASITTSGFSLLGDGLLRLLRADFPIAIVLEHLHMAVTGNADTDAQHFILAIHTALEAWNRMFGLEYWIDDDCWEWFVKKARRTLLGPIYDTVGPEVKTNLASAFRHANRTTTSWREKQFFNALQIDVSDKDNARALAVRDEILHNGHFLVRWAALTPEEQQQRRDDVERLHRLALLAVFRLTAFEGVFLDPIKLIPEHVSPVPLPDRIAPTSATKSRAGHEVT